MISMTQPSNRSGSPAMKPTSTPGRVLVVDDDPDILRVIEATLASSGHQVDCTSKSSEALSMALRTRPDVVILDLMMPEPSGTDLLEAFRGHPETRSIPIVFLSALSDSTVKADLLRQGASDFVGKPFEPEELVARVERLIPERPRSGSRLEGSIEVYPLSDILQILLREGRAATMSVAADDTHGTILLKDGKLAGACFDRYLGDEAMLTMLTLKHGSFRLEPQHAELPNGARPTLGIESLLMEAAWLQDEISRLDTSLDPENLLVATQREIGEIPEGFENLPIHLVLQLLGQEPIPFRSIASAIPAASLRLRLAMSWLLAAGIVAKAPLSIATSDSQHRLTKIATELIQVGEARGFAPGRLPISFFVEETLMADAEGLLEPHFGTVDQRYTTRSETGSKGILDVRGTIALPSGTVVLGLSRLQQPPQSSIDAVLEISFGVVVLYRGDSVQAVEDLATRLQATRRKTVGVLVPADDAAQAHASHHDFRGQWLVLNSQPRDLVEVLDLLQACSQI